MTMLKDAQLFEALGFFEWRRRPRHELREKCASVRVQTDVAQGLRARRAAIRGIAMHWNQRAREIERAAIDTEGCLWSAQFDGGCIVRYAPDGRVDRVLRLPVTKPTSCGFGGPGYRQLFVTTATRGLGEEELRAEPLAGRVLVLDAGVAGLPPVPFMARAVATEGAS